MLPDGGWAQSSSASSWWVLWVPDSEGAGKIAQCEPGDSESTFITAGDSGAKEGLRVEEATGESLGGALLWLAIYLIYFKIKFIGVTWVNRIL